MTEYHTLKVYLTEGQKNKIASAYKNKKECTLQIDRTKTGNYDLKLTKTQIDKLKKGSARITLSATQLQKTGGIFPFLAALIPGLIAAGKAAALGATGALGAAAIKKMTGTGCSGKKKASGKGIAHPWQGKGIAHPWEKR